MTSQVSFTGTYKVNNQDPASFAKFQNYALNKELEPNVKTSLKDEIIKRGNFGSFDYKAEQTLIVPDYLDIDVETFCANNGISYKKYDTRNLLNPMLITSRIDYAPKGYKKVSVDVEKLEELIKNQNSNLAHCQNVYDKYYSDSVDTMLRNGDSIPATTLIIRNSSGNEDLREYVDRFGAENLNNNQIFVTFNQKTDDPDHCTYFALKDMGMNKIPVYVDSQSYEAGVILGLF